ncbi:MAG: DNA alkylation repair protein [Alphaproteobacteria bacterium]|nr:DNA alkylation repair protein [Alphaproteobacteria bacterium]
MLDTDSISEALQKASDADTARKRSKHIQPFRGVRGTPVADITRRLAAAWKAQPAKLPRDEEALNRLFYSAWEDGLVAVGLLAAAALESPHAALDLAERWLPAVDDVETADALGWLVLGPAFVAAGEPAGEALAELRGRERPHARRAGVMGAMALLPEPISGPAAAALREKLGERRLSMSAEPDDAAVHAVLDAFLRDEDPHVRKAVSRLSRSWAQSSPDPAEAWLLGVRGGVPKTLREEVEKGIKRGRRKARPAE